MDAAESISLSARAGDVADSIASTGADDGRDGPESEKHHDLYGSEYYEGYQTLRTEWTDDAPAPYRWGEAFWEKFFDHIADEVITRLQPKTVLDAGCAIGFLVKALRDHGADAEGFDISAWAISQVHPDARPFCRVASVTDELHRDYDLITCIEVVEHVTPEDAETAISNLCRHILGVLFSSTPVHFDEVTHVNVHPPDYWAELFSRHGFFRDFDFDTTFIAPHAVLFRPVPHLFQVVRGYERWHWDVERELQGIRAHRDRLHGEVEQLHAQFDSIAHSRTYRLGRWVARVARSPRRVWRHMHR
jgi:2-polyprenyl-3-methyl-5-hydroxy-6-metoxy-1,4-benzoquinol methylase